MGHRVAETRSYIGILGASESPWPIISYWSKISLTRSSGFAKFVEVGDGRRCHPWQLEAAFSDQTAAVAYLFAPFLARRALPFPQVCEIAHAHGVPVIVDAASFIPPRANLRRFTAEGADMVVYSGGKSIRGPQGKGRARRDGIRCRGTERHWRHLS